jgi:ABC-2 type transport system ATP-binding protein
MKALEITELHKSFGKFRALNGLNLSVGENRVFGFLGPNGAGKTTTIRMIVGLSKPTTGKIKIYDQEVVFGKTDTNKLFGYLPETPSFYNWMKGEEYLKFIAETFGISKEEQAKRIPELLKMVNLTEHATKRIGGYSNGMKQRLGIAQALVGDPKILIMDEPVSALDPIGRREVLEIIEKLKKTKTIFMSTHVLADVDRICDDVAIIKDGKLIVQSPLPELKAKYAKSILSIEFEKDPEKLVSKIKAAAWATKVEKSGNEIKVWLKSEEAIHQNLPLELIAKEKIGVLRYGLSLPEVEDLFIDLLEKN